MHFICAQQKPYRMMNCFNDNNAALCSMQSHVQSLACDMLARKMRQMGNDYAKFVLMKQNRMDDPSNVKWTEKMEACETKIYFRIAANRISIK